MIKMGANIDRAMFSNGETLLMDAAKKGNIKMFNFLLKQGAGRDVRCHTGRTITDYIKMDFQGKT